MPRILRVDVGNLVYHVINRANGRIQIFHKDKDYLLFESVLAEAKELNGMRILAYCIMPNHWHLVLHPRKDGDLQEFMRWLTMTHTQRQHAAHKTAGSGHLYQGRYKSFLVEKNNYFLQLCRYVERNPLRARLVKKAEHWKWSSLWRREKGSDQQKKLLSSWPEDMPEGYLDYVNMREPDEDLRDIQYSVKRGKPYGADAWVNKMVDMFDLEPTVNNPWRPKKSS